MQTLTITNTPLGDAAFAQLMSFPKLKQVAFPSTQVTNAGLASLPSLQYLAVLNLSGTQVDDGSVEHFKKLNKLTSLHLNQTKLTPTGIAELKKALPNCKIEWDGANSPFVTLRSGAAAARHATLEEALAASQPQDVIEVHGNGPFPIGGPKPVVFPQKEFTLKAAAGFRPLFVSAPSAAENTSTSGTAVLLEFTGGTARFEDIDCVSSETTLFLFNGVRDVQFLRCRCVNTAGGVGLLMQFSCAIEQKVSLKDCLLVSAKNYGGLSFYHAPAKVELTNTFLFAPVAAVGFDTSGHSLRMTRCTTVGMATSWYVHNNEITRRLRGTAEPSRCLILGPALGLADKRLSLTEDVRWQGTENVYGVTQNGESGIQLPDNVNVPFDEWVNSPVKPETGSKLVPTKAKPFAEFLDADPAVMFRKLKTYLEELRTLHPDVGADPAVADPGLVPLATAPPILSLNDPAFQQWMKEVAAQPAEEQVKAVAQKLQDLNPDFDGKVTHSNKSGEVFELSFSGEHVRDISPVRVLAGLKSLGSNSPSKGKLTDLSPLRGLLLTTISLENTPVSDLSPLKGMPLTRANFGATRVSDLSPLQGMPLSDLVFYGTLVPDLAAVKDLKLTKINIGGPLVSDLSPLKGMPLTMVNCAGTQVSDLSPLRGMALTLMDCQNTKVTDLTPLKGMPLTNLRCDFVPQRDTEILRSFKTLESINYKPAAEFWKSVESPQPVKKP